MLSSMIFSIIFSASSLETLVKPSFSAASLAESPGSFARSLSISSAASLATLPSAMRATRSSRASSLIESTSTPSPLRPLRVTTKRLAITFGLTRPPYFRMSLSMRSRRISLITCSASSLLNPYSSTSLLILTSTGSGLMASASLCMSSVTSRGGISVSGYILALPGLGLRNFVVPSSRAPRVSSGTPWKAILALSTTVSRALTAFSGSSATITMASTPFRAPRTS